MKFEVLKQDTQSLARLARMTLPHGVVETPVFMPVGTQGTVKGCLPKELEAMDVQIILGNTYHLMLRPTTERLEKLGGLHGLMGWNRPILTDSGGYQVFSLAKLAKISDEGVRFKNHLDGREMLLSPEIVMEAQRQIGSDIAMVLDICSVADVTQDQARADVDMTTAWARRAKEYCQKNKGPHNVFGIVQGSVYAAERERSAKDIVAMDFDGYAIGGVSVISEAQEVAMAQIDMSVKFLPADKPRYAMGIGNPVQLLDMVERGVDMFDCVIPTREARHGVAYTNDGRITIKNEQFKEDMRPLDAEIISPASSFSRAYIRHLFTSDEILALVLLSYHNIAFFNSLMAQARAALKAGNYMDWKRAWVARYTTGAKKA